VIHASQAMWQVTPLYHVLNMLNVKHGIMELSA